MSTSPPPPAVKPTRFEGVCFGPSFEGCLLVAPPGNTDATFAGTCVYLCSHNGDGAMGLVTNRAAPERPFPDVLRHMGILDGDVIDFDHGALSCPVVRGGPHNPTQGFVLHSPEFSLGPETKPTSGRLNVTSCADILLAIAEGRGPMRAVLAFGYAYWDAGQVEREIRDGGWLVCDPDDDLVFGVDYGGKHGRALRVIGIRDANAFLGVGGRA